MWKTDDLNVVGTKPLVTPHALKTMFPVTQAASETVYRGRTAVGDILAGKSKRFLVVVGPCSIHEAAAAFDYAERLSRLQGELDSLLFVMRAYFEKPRTTTGWKGLINDPHLDGSYDMCEGLQKAREILVRIAEIGVPTATEMLEPIVPQYIADLITWASIGARTTESQTHREMASGLSMPVGFKNSTDGNLQNAINAMLSARNPHHFLGIDQDGQTCVIETRGNPWTHIILRGGCDRPNYDPVSVADTEDQLRAAGLSPLIVVDCSHANCGKRYKLQTHVLRDIVQQKLAQTDSLIGVMVESNLREGNQPIPKDLTQLEYGVSITDPCLGWDATEEILRFTHSRLSAL